MKGAGLAAKPALTGDVTTALMPRNLRGGAALVARHEMVVCGLMLAPLIFDVYGGGIIYKPLAKDGMRMGKSDVLGLLKGRMDVILQAERVMLNFLQRISGVATQTARYVEALGKSKTRLLDTRKTTPGFRVLEKYAVACGGGWNHRMGLFDRVLLKDNHLAAAEAGRGASLAQLASCAKKRHPKLIVEVEVDELAQIEPVLEAGADVILLDNFSRNELVKAVRMINGGAFTEASGGITIKNLPALADIGLDFISCGALVHQSVWADIGLDWK